MSTKSQHSGRYQHVPTLLRRLREAAKLTQRDLGDRLARPQSWVYKSETGIRRVDVAEFLDWVEACGADPVAVIKQLRRGR